jgi:hypothetical protein
MGKRQALLKALEHLDAGDWEAAHPIVQADDSLNACWAHGIVHVMEGDLDNARYWYRRAQRPFSTDTARELAALTLSL